MNQSVGQFVWFDIPVTDFNKAKALYGELLNWKFTEMGPDYLGVQVGKDTIGGLRKLKQKTQETDGPIIYFKVDTLEPSVTKAKKLGATTVGGKVDIGKDMGCYQCFRDQDKNLFAIWAQK